MAINITELEVEMIRAGVNQKELAFRCDVNKNTISGVMTGRTNCSLGLANKICDALEINDSQRRCEIFLPLSSHKRDESPGDK